MCTAARQSKESKSYYPAERKTRIEEKDTFPVGKHTIVRTVH